MSADPRPPGRPHLVPGEQSEPVNIRLPHSLYDRADAIARTEKKPLREVLRDAIRRGLPPDNSLTV